MTTNYIDEIYKAMDSFLVESEDMQEQQIIRTTAKLNQDRHLFVDRMVELFQQEQERILKEIKEFSFAKSWELDKDKFYIDATPDEIIKIIKNK